MIFWILWPSNVVLRDIEANNPLHVRNDGESALDFLWDPNNPVPALILLDLTYAKDE